MNYEQSKNIVNITQNSFALSPPIISRAVQEPIGTDPPAATDWTQPAPTEPTAPTVDDGFHSPKPEINGLEIGSPPLKYPTDASFFRWILRFF